MRISAPSALALVLLAASAPAQEPNPYAPAIASDRVAILDRDAMMGRPGAEAAIMAWLETHPAESASQRARLYRRLCELFGVRTWHAARLRACRAGAALAPSGERGDDDFAMSAALADTLPIRTRGTAAVSLLRNAFGTSSANVTVNGVTLPWIVDTGAEISVVSQTNADRLGLRYVGDAVRVGTTTADVSGRIGVIDVLQIGDAIVENVPVLVLPDARLTMAANPVEPAQTIPAILGLQVFAAFGRMAWLDGGDRLVMGEAAPEVSNTGMPIYWHDSGLGIPISTGREILGAHFDTGASRSYIFPAGRSLLTRHIEATGISRTTRTGGAGGVVEQQLIELPTLPLSVGGAGISLQNVTLAEHPRRVARIGFDAVRRFRTLVLDFEHMIIAAEAATRVGLPDRDEGRSARRLAD